jgi:hypothetical protein
MFVRLFAIHSVPVIASVTKLSKALAEVLRKVERGLPPPRGGGGKQIE